MKPHNTKPDQMNFLNSVSATYDTKNLLFERTHCTSPFLHIQLAAGRSPPHDQLRMCVLHCHALRSLWPPTLVTLALQIALLPDTVLGALQEK